MAGLGRKVFTRERATVADVNGYLMDQVIFRYASAAAANAAIPSPSEGMHRYLNDVNRTEFYNGSVWVPLGTRFIARPHTPVNPGVPSGNARESGVADGPAIAGFTVHGTRRVEVKVMFRVGQSVVGTGAALIYVKVDGVIVGQGLSRSADETNTVIGYADVAAGSHTVALRVEAFGGDVQWIGAQIILSEGFAE